MTLISNIRIGRKIALVLGGTVLLLGGLSAVSLWGLGISETLTEDTLDRLAMSQLAATIASEQANISVAVGKMVVARSVPEALAKEELDARKSRDVAVEEFRARANTTESKIHAAEMGDITVRRTAANSHIMALLRAGQDAEAAHEYGLPLGKLSLRGKAGEASEWERQLVARNEKKRKRTSSTIWMALIGGSLLAAAGAVLGGVILTRGIATPLAATVVHLDRIAQGDLSKDAPAEFQARGDEIGALTRSLQMTTVSLRKMISEISSGIQVLSASSNQLTASSAQMTSGSRHASDKANSVAAAAEEMSSNISSVALGMEQTTANLAHVSSATEQMTFTISEIAQNSEKARRITDAANRQTGQITGQINQLGLAAREIGKVTETITEISAQTNLLALNATIEAARAGSAEKASPLWRLKSRRWLNKPPERRKT